MATLRGNASSYDIGNNPPEVKWTFVRGDTAAFKVYVTDDERQPLTISDWSIAMKVKRPNTAQETFEPTDAATEVLSLTPTADADDLAGEFTVKITAAQSQILETGDIFDIELSLPQDQIVWTVAQGSVVVIEDITD